jgi:hypothetical protein
LATLGKRKHVDEAAEAPDASSKKRKQSEALAEQNGNTGEGRVPTTTEVNGTGSDAVEPKPQAKQTTPKGDPNYRKKKGLKKVRQSLDRRQFNADSSADSFGEARDHLAPSPTNGDTRTSLAVSTETALEPPLDSVPLRKTKLSKALRENSVSETPARSTPPALLRRKSVTFTPDTKTVDGNSASTLFKIWVAEQKLAGAEFTSADVEQFVPPPKIHPANDLPAPSLTQAQGKGEKKSKRAGDREGSERGVSPTVTGAPVKGVTTSEEKNSDSVKPEGSRKKNSSYYLSYLSEYHNSRSNWKFNKAKQAELLKNALNVFRIPAEHEEALVAYIKGLQGAGARDRLSQACRDIIDEKDNGKLSTMDDPEVRKAAQEEAMKERVEKQKKRRRMEADMEGLADASDPAEFIRKIKKKRASALLKALSASAPLPTVVVPKPTPAAQPFVARKTAHKTLFEDEPTSTTRLKPRNRKSRTNIVDDDTDSSSSSDSSSDDSSSSTSDESSESDSEDSDAGSDSDSASDDGSSTVGGSDSDSSVSSLHKERGPSIDKLSTFADDGSSSSSSDGESDSDVKIKREKGTAKKDIKIKEPKRAKKLASAHAAKSDGKNKVEAEPASSGGQSSSTADSESDTSSTSDADSDDGSDKSSRGSSSSGNSSASGSESDDEGDSDSDSS